jgi:hypothetical protein
LADRRTDQPHAATGFPTLTAVGQSIATPEADKQGEASRHPATPAADGVLSSRPDRVIRSDVFTAISASAAPVSIPPMRQRAHGHFFARRRTRLEIHAPARVVSA